MGMALAYRMARDGERVTVLEADAQVGGLSTWSDFGGFVWDRFYHVVLPTDRNLIALINELGLERDLHWRRTYTGFFVDGEMHSISNNLEFLRFPLLSPLSKARLAWTLLYCSRIDDWKRLEQETVESFLLRVSGRENYEKLWKPLLLAKLGQNYKRVSAVFIWSYVKRLFSARDKSASAEHLGHVSGGYKMVFERLEQQIRAAGGDVRTSTPVRAVVAESDGTLGVDIAGTKERFDRVVCTSPVSVLKRIVAPELLDLKSDGGDVEYLGVVCPVVVSRKALVPFYVVNIADRDVPFTGIIGMSTVVDTKFTAERHLTYLPKYVLSTDSYLERSDEEIRDEFLAGLARMLPDYSSAEIEAVHVHRAIKVQPLQVVGYSGLVPRVRTRHDGLFVLNTSQFVNSTLNNNEVVGAVNRFYESYRTRWQSKAV